MYNYTQEGGDTEDEDWNQIASKRRWRWGLRTCGQWMPSKCRFKGRNRGNMYIIPDYTIGEEFHPWISARENRRLCPRTDNCSLVTETKWKQFLSLYLRMNVCESHEDFILVFCFVVVVFYNKEKKRKKEKKRGGGEAITVTVFFFFSGFLRISLLLFLGNGQT